MERLMIPKVFTRESEFLEPIEPTHVITKEFVKGLYKFLLLPNNGVLDINKYFEDKEGYVRKGYKFDEDTMEVFVDRHRVWIKR
jgi:hypothetical protein